MRPLILLTVIVLHGFEASAGQVIVQGAKTKLVPTTKQLSDMCGTNGDYDACTRFVAFRLEASCRATGDGYGVAATATFLPWVLLRNIRQMSHEHEHIRDVQLSVTRYVEELEQRVFRGGADCEGHVLRERELFGERLRGYAIESNAARHASLRKKTTRIASGAR